MPDNTPTPELAEIAQRLAASADAVDARQAELDTARGQRDALIIQATRLGATRRAVAEVARVTATRVQQLVESDPPIRPLSQRNRAPVTRRRQR